MNNVHFEHPAYYEVLSHMIELRLYAYRIDWSATCEFSSSIIEHYPVLSYLLKQPRALSSRKGKKNFANAMAEWCPWFHLRDGTRGEHLSAVIIAAQCPSTVSRGGWGGLTLQEASLDFIASRASTLGQLTIRATLGTQTKRTTGQKLLD